MSHHTKAAAGHVVPLRVYLTIGAALFLLTAVTVSVSLVDLGGWNVVVALAIAGTKATLVALYFMHLLYDKKIYLIILVTAILFLVVFIILTMFDTTRRDDIHRYKAESIVRDAEIYRSEKTYPKETALPADDRATADSSSAGDNGGE